MTGYFENEDEGTHKIVEVLYRGPEVQAIYRNLLGPD